MQKEDIQKLVDELVFVVELLCLLPVILLDAYKFQGGVKND
jgi:hypothetical protein